MTPSLALLLVYSVALVALGIVIGRGVRTTSAFFVAGRQLGPGLLFTTILAANIGAGSTVGAAGLGYSDGAAGWWWVGSAAIGTLVLAFWIGPRMWRIAKDHDLQTVGDFLELRYGAAVRGVVAALLWLGTLAILAGQLIAVAWVLHEAGGISKPVGCLLGGAAMTLYFMAGGLVTSAWVNLVQLVVLWSGFLVAVPLVVARLGGPGALLEPVARDPSTFFSSGPSGLVYLPLLVPAFVVSPGLLQKVFGARDARAVRVGVGWSGVVLLVFSCLPVALGMAAARLHPGLAHPELALPAVLFHDLPTALGMLGLAAVFSAELSSADAILFMLSTSLSRDLYRRFLRPDASDERVLAVARGAAVLGGGLGVGLALLLPSVIGSLSIFYALLSVTLCVPLVAGVVGRRPRRSEAVAAMAGGVVALLAFRTAGAAEILGPISPVFAALVVSAVAWVVVRSLGRRHRLGGPFRAKGRKGKP